MMLLILAFLLHMVSLMLMITCSKQRRQALMTAPSKREGGHSIRRASNRETSQSQKSQKSQSQKSQKGSKTDQSQSNKSAKNQRGVPRETFVAVRKLPSKRESDLRPAGENSLQTHPPTPPRDDGPKPLQRCASPKSNRLSQRSIPQRDRSSRLPAYPPSATIINTNEPPPRVTRRSVRNSLIDGPPEVLSRPPPPTASNRNDNTSNKSNKSQISNKSNKSQSTKSKSSKKAGKSSMKEEASPWANLMTKGNSKEKHSTDSRRTKSKSKSKKSKEDAKKEKSKGSKSKKSKSSKSSKISKLLHAPKSRKSGKKPKSDDA